jgi:hypothetical protein
LITCRDAAAEEAHLLQRRLGVDLDGARGVEHGVLGEGGGVEEVVDRAVSAGAVHGGEPCAAVGDHGGLEGVDAVGLAQVGLDGVAVGAGAALAGEDGEHMVPRGKVFYSLAHALDYPN